jgi:16S rRNA (guanine527-N7)-methyltransferase
MVKGEVAEVEEFTRKVHRAFCEALDFMGIDLSQQGDFIVESWVRYFLGWRGRRVVGFDSPEDIGVKLLADSFAVSFIAECVSPSQTLDIGSGNGWPGLAVKALFGDAHLVLLDSRKGSCDFMEGYIRTSGLSGVKVLEARAEEAGHVCSQRERYSFVTTRAMAAPSICLELCTGFLELGGKAALWVGPGQELPRDPDFLREIGLRYLSRYEYSLPHGMGERLLAVYIKESLIEDNVPRSYASIKRTSRKNLPHSSRG